MKNIAAQMINFDREQMRRIANNMPEQYDEKPQVQQVAQIINGVFSQLLATFPASLANRDQNELNEIRRQWVMAFRENGITTMEQVNAGMRVARRQERPFLPSPGQFVAWCKQSGGALGITVDQVITEYWDWRNRSFEFTSSEHFPWSQPVMYHICVELRHRSTERQLTHGELAREAGDLLDMWERRVTEGKPVPPVRRAIAAPAAEHGPTPI
ncbi:TPA: phage replication protein, partial [Escherichia coli]|nr:phage replication protein [Escherichia coli]